MSEIEKLYENANIEPIDTKYEPMSNMVFTADCIGNTWTREQYMKEVPIYPKFTAEKQLELIKWLGIRDELNFYQNKVTKDWVFYDHEKDVTHYNFELCLASWVNYLWQDLTETEKAEIKEILK